MREVNQPPLIVPDVLAVHDDPIAGCHRDALADVDVVVDEQRLRRSRKLHDETLVRARWPGVIGEKSRDRTFRGDLEAGEVLGVRALDRGIPCDRGGAARREHGAEDERAKTYERLVPAQCGVMALITRPATMRSASAITTTTAMRRKSLVT